MRLRYRQLTEGERNQIYELLQEDVSFTKPHLSRECGLNENTTCSIRQYFPKGANLRRSAWKK